MNTGRNDYSGIKDTLGITTIGEDEPVFIFRAQDPLASSMLRIYADNLARQGAPKEMVTSIHSHADAFEKWQKKKPMADIVAGNPSLEIICGLKGIPLNGVVPSVPTSVSAPAASVPIVQQPAPTPGAPVIDPKSLTVPGSDKPGITSKTTTAAAAGLQDIGGNPQQPTPEPPPTTLPPPPLPANPPDPRLQQAVQK